MDTIKPLFTATATAIGSAREDLPVFARHARQRRCAGRGEGRLEHESGKVEAGFPRRSCSTKS